MALIVGLDAGNANVKVAGPLGTDYFISDIGEYRKRNLKDSFSKDDMVFEYNGRRGFAGSLARYESEFGGSIMGDSKAHEDTLIRCLLALHRYSNETNFYIVSGQPISKHDQEEKIKIKSMLEKKHIFTLNGEQKEITILGVSVAAEGGAAYWASPRKGKVRIIDVGGGTVNYATLIDGKYVDKDSGTLSFGNETNKSKDMAALARGIATHLLKKWGRDDIVLLVGGVAEKLLPFIIQYFQSAEVLRPVLQTPAGKINNVSALYANAVAFYNIGRQIYGKH